MFTYLFAALRFFPMIAVIQRVSEASVTIAQQKKAQIGHGLLVLIGIEAADTSEDIDWLASKIVNIRIFNDAQETMNLSVIDTEGEVLVVSQFTLHASTKKGNRPSYMKAARPELSIPLYHSFVNSVGEKLGKPVQTGEFGADMKVHLLNDGPVTLIMDTKNKV